MAATYLVDHVLHVLGKSAPGLRPEERLLGEGEVARSSLLWWRRRLELLEVVTQRSCAVASRQQALALAQCHRETEEALDLTPALGRDDSLAGTASVTGDAASVGFDATLAKAVSCRD